MDLAQNQLVIRHILLQAKHGFGPKPICNTVYCVQAILLRPTEFFTASTSNVYRVQASLLRPTELFTASTSNDYCVQG